MARPWRRRRVDARIGLRSKLTQPVRCVGSGLRYRAALLLDPRFAWALVNLAGLDRMRGMDQQGAEALTGPCRLPILHSTGWTRAASIDAHRRVEATAIA
jgi:hypothetical protein